MKRWSSLRCSRRVQNFQRCVPLALDSPSALKSFSLDCLAGRFTGALFLLARPSKASGCRLSAESGAQKVQDHQPSRMTRLTTSLVLTRRCALRILVSSSSASVVFRGTACHEAQGQGRSVDPFATQNGRRGRYGINSHRLCPKPGFSDRLIALFPIGWNDHALRQPRPSATLVPHHDTVRHAPSDAQAEAQGRAARRLNKPLPASNPSIMTLRWC